MKLKLFFEQMDTQTFKVGAKLVLVMGTTGNARLLKSIRKDTGGVAPLKENERLHADPKDKANILNRQYESTWTQEDTHDIPSPDGEPYPPMKDVHVSTE